MRYLANAANVPQKNAREMERYCRTIMEVLWDSVNADDLCAKAAELIESVADSNFTRNDEGGFHRDDIRTQAFTEKVVARCKEGLSQNG